MDNIDLLCAIEFWEQTKKRLNNPLFESSSPPPSLEFNNKFIRPSSSPPPKFKFLRDAEEKLYRGLMEEVQRKAKKNQNLVAETTEVKVKDSPNSTTMLSVINNREREQK
ncbi:hypothetical protein HN51_058956 [Arachis hypogaea]